MVDNLDILVCGLTIFGGYGDGCSIASMMVSLL